MRLRRLVSKINRLGTEEFTFQALSHLERDNPELLQMAHAFASERRDYARTMQGFALFYEALLMQSLADRAKPQ